MVCIRSRYRYNAEISNLDTCNLERQISCPVYTPHWVVSEKQVNLNRLHSKGRNVEGTEQRLVLGNYSQAHVASFLDSGNRSSGTLALPSGSAFFSLRNSPCLQLSGFPRMLPDHRKLGPRHLLTSFKILWTFYVSNCSSL